jgi:oligoribonuclease (3'-5' exoribonuclease)
MALAFIDTETGGLSTDTSLLDLAVVVTGRDLHHIATFTVRVKPSDGIYHVTPGALRVNRINIADHDTDAVPYDIAAGRLTEFLDAFHVPGSQLIPAGWNIPFDEKFIRAHMPGFAWDTYFTYRQLDGSSVLRYLQLMGKMPNHLGSLNSCVKFLKLAEEQRHTAVADCEMTIAVMKEFFNVQ